LFLQSCLGSRLDTKLSSVRIHDKTFQDLHYMTMIELLNYVENILKNHVSNDKAKNKIIGTTIFDNANPYAPGSALWNWVMAGLKIITPEQARQELISQDD
jgi:hypothetical protein